MATKWVEPTAQDATAFMRGVVVNAMKQDDTQVSVLLATVVQRVRGVIAAAGLTPLSAKATEVPPEGVQHTYVLTIFALVAGSPNFQFVTADTFEKQRVAAEQWLERVAEGRPVSYPKDVSEDEPRSVVRYGSESLEFDMTTD